MTKKLRLSLYLAPADAARVIGSLWARGALNNAQYRRNMRAINAAALAAEDKRNKKLRNIYAGIREFYKKDGINEN